MDPLAVIGLLCAGLLMGGINNLAGAGGVIGLIALEEFAGLPSATANASLRLSAVAIGVAGLVGFLSKGQRVPARAWGFGLAALPGAVAGAILAVTLPVLAFRVYLVAILAVLLWQQIPRRNAGPQSTIARESSPRWGLLGFFLVGAHMGFVQVGTGLVAILCLVFVLGRDLVRVNAAKMAVVIVSSSAATLVFVAESAVAWSPALWLALGCGLGSFLGSRWSVAKGHAAIRRVVIAITSLALLRIVWQIATTA